LSAPAGDRPLAWRCGAGWRRCRRGETAAGAACGVRPRSRWGRDTRSSDPPHHEVAALRERPAGYHGREPSGRAAGDQDLDVLRRAELRDRRRIVLGIGELAQDVLGQAIAAVLAWHQLVDGALQPLE